MNLLDLSKVHPSWDSFLTQEKIDYIKYLEKILPENINPEPKNVLRFLYTDKNNIKCVIVGQDPYPALPKEVEGNLTYIATGRSFEIGTLKSWNEKFAQHSLKNMVRLIYKAYYNELITYEECKKKISSGDFPILHPDKWYDAMEEQGVLFLNKTLSCEQGKPLSHKDLWNDFSTDLILNLSDNENINWFLWGGEARNLKQYIFKGKIYEAEHPRLYNTTKEEAFLNSKCFEETKNIVCWLSKKE